MGVTPWRFKSSHPHLRHVVDPAPLSCPLPRMSRAVIEELDGQEIDDFLRRQVVGRVGCHADGETYVVPSSTSGTASASTSSRSRAGRPG